MYCLTDTYQYLIQNGPFTWKMKLKFPVSRNPFFKHGITLIPAWIYNQIPSIVRVKIIYPFPNVKGTTVEVRE